jgi:hypothetical protein
MSETCKHQAVKRIRKEYRELTIFNTNKMEYL